MKTRVPSWFRKAIIYQVYPQSFFDANADGIGDIPGIAAKLDYMQSLNCDTLWLNPCFVSPFQDAGYDIADHLRVAPRYGTNRDLENLFREAHRRGMRVLLDLVPGHTSIDHPWFQASSRRAQNRSSNWYVWTDSVWRKEPGLMFVRGFAERNGNFLTNFFWFQPALNFGFARPDPKKPWQMPPDHPDIRALKEEFRRIMRFWLDRGADGFRVDMAFSLVKDDTERVRTSALWKEFREFLDREYPEAVLVSEWCHPSQAIPAGFHADFLIHFSTGAYTSLFRAEAGRNIYPGAEGRSYFDPDGEGDINRFLPVYLEHVNATAGRGYISLPSGNHDLPRLSLGRDTDDLEIAFAFLLTLPGVPAIYYGDEIGMKHVKNLPSKEGGYNRTGARTPMQWSKGAKAGFSQADPKDFYLPLDPSPERPSVAAQDKDPRSLLNRLRRLTGLRREQAALGNDGAFLPLFTKNRGYPFIYERRLGESRVLIILNPARRKVDARFTVSPLPREPRLLEGRGCSLKGGPAIFDTRLQGRSFGIYHI
ncbi:MAG: alpha-amylase family glycosyl hydrolase [Candidatus Aureabacteria bacterium]|nr:alpha-amylase family glycosyl hydrolase [Candidatus Auribacterota bacterium]